MYTHPDDPHYANLVEVHKAMPRIAHDVDVKMTEVETLHLLHKMEPNIIWNSNFPVYDLVASGCALVRRQKTTVRAASPTEGNCLFVFNNLITVFKKRHNKGPYHAVATVPTTNLTVATPSPTLDTDSRGGGGEVAEVVAARNHKVLVTRRGGDHTDSARQYATVTPTQHSLR
eukprot:TRINITY_DN458_c0_g1_i5.p1 TRINITY_DN458_c0_g1~~TRINITY_DN458_c0_g1_i5.p1  ORF type:complete len:173 (+),score=54.00 TRINITY_DN458_c0_g1_i5:374-892(+)